MNLPSEHLQALHPKAQALLAELHPLTGELPESLQPTWAEHLERLEELAQFLDSGGMAPTVKWARPPVTHPQWIQFGRLLRDKRNAAGMSRVQLGHRAKLSDATIKFTETARHPPSRTTLIRLIGVADLQLRWSDVPGRPALTADPDAPAKLRTQSPERTLKLNCLLTPGYDSLDMIADLARFLNGAGGYVEQTHAYLDHYSAADYLAICHNSLSAAALRSSMPLGEVARRIVAACGRAELQVIALGAGDGIAETQLIGHLMDAKAASVELCLLDISQPLLSCAYRQAADRLAGMPNVHVWALQGNFHHLPMYTELGSPAVVAAVSSRCWEELWPTWTTSRGFSSKACSIARPATCFFWTSLWSVLPSLPT